MKIVMKIDGLTLGDWVTDEGVPGQVIMVSVEGVAMIVKEEQIVYLNSERLNPIPLTREILLANGFTKFVDGYRRTFYNYVVDNNLMLDISDWEDEGLKVAVGGKFRELKYVHELQHILRLIGLGEVANNFKIK